jgi:pimeloyl-ACP methyl ester carboxylesterase
MRALRVRTPVLDVACFEAGDAAAPAVILLHGFPYSADCYAQVAPILAGEGYRVIVPELRGYGGTRFLAPQTMRSVEQAALGDDLLALMDALQLRDAVLAGYDWGGRAACIVAALWPHRVRGLVSGNGYNIQDIAASGQPSDPEQERRLWYQYYFQQERGRAGLRENRDALCRLLWSLWSPTWAFDDATFARSAAALGNPDFVEVAIHSYRHRFANAAGDPRYAAIEARLATQPAITVPTIAIQGTDDGVNPAAASQHHGRHFSGGYERRLFAGVGHNPPQEAPQLFAEAVLDISRR